MIVSESSSFAEAVAMVVPLAVFSAKAVASTFAETTGASLTSVTCFVDLLFVHVEVRFLIYYLHMLR